jgi:chromosome segregation ATPase
MQKSLASMNTLNKEHKNLLSNLQEKAERARKKILKATDDFNKQMTAVKNEAQKIQANINNAKAIIDKATAVQQTLQTLYNGVVNSNGNFSVLTNNVFTSLGVLQGQTKDIVNSTIVRKG